MLGPDHEAAYLNDQLPESHPMYPRIHAMYKDSIEGKRLEKFRKQNSELQDGLNAKTHGQLDMMLRELSANFAGEPTDRIGKIMLIREKKLAEEKEKMKDMTKEEREAYVAEKQREADLVRKSNEKNEEEAREAQAKAADAQAKRSALQQRMYEMNEKARQEREAGRKMLEEEAAARQNIKPAELRKKAMEELAKEEAEDEPEETVEEPVEKPKKRKYSRRK